MQYKQQVLDWQKRDAKKALNVTETDDDLVKELIEEKDKKGKAGDAKAKKNKKKDYWGD